MKEEKFEIIVQIITDTIEEIEYFAEENEIDVKEIYEELQKTIKNRLETKMESDSLEDILS